MEFDDLCLTDPHFFAVGDPWAVWKELRTHDPVHLTQSRFGKPFWSVTRHAEAREVFNDAARFSSQRSGPSLPTDAQLADPGKVDHARIQRAGGMIPSTDPPRHTKLRANFAERFRLPAVEALEGMIRPLAAGIVERMLDQREFDLMPAIAVLPNAVIFTLMGVPESDWATLFRFANMHAAPNDPDFSVGTPAETRQAGSGGSMKYCKELALERRKNPGDDLISAIATAKVDGEYLDDDTLGMMGHMFVIAGYDTTRNSLLEGLHQMALNGGELERVRADRGLLRPMSDEFIRYASPVAHLLRTAAVDTELAGRKIRENDLVAVWIASANRDEAIFANPDAFDVGRNPNPHVSFGYGPHFCLGAFLARLEIRVMMDEFLNRVAGIELAGPGQRIEAIQFWGWKRLPVRVTPC